MKKVLTIVLSVIMLLSLITSCGSSKDKKEPDKAEKQEKQADKKDDSESVQKSEEDKEKVKESKSGDGVFKIGLPMVLSSSVGSNMGINIRDGVQLAVDEINENGGLNGEELELLIYDTQGSPEEAVRVVTKLAQEDDVDLIVGPMFSGECSAAGSFANNYKVPMMAIGTSASFMKEDWPYVYRATVNNSRAVPSTVKMMEGLGYEKIAIFHGQDDSANNVAKDMEAAWKESGHEVLLKESYDVGDTDFSAQAANIVAANPDAVYVSLVVDMTSVIVKQLRQSGYDGIIFSYEVMYTANIELAGGNNADHVAFTHPYVTYESLDDVPEDLTNMREFLEKFEERYGSLPETDGGYRGWDTMLVVAEAAKIAGVNEREALKEALGKVVVEGLSGPLDYTNGDREGISVDNLKTFIIEDGIPVDFNTWLEEGYDAFLEKTGRSK